MKSIYIVLGFISLALGLIGIPVPGLPTTPFLLLSLFFFGKGSERLYNWFITTKLYDKYLRDYDKSRAMTMKQKLSILAIAAPFCLFSFLVMPSFWGRLVLVLIVIFQYYYFFFKIKTLEK
ncbi:hypothetical protein A1D22_08585 [Pasteurellaceae bacterium LFhippo2]|nr:hypothetical protein [Pasteurellaceae bacterium LFhippo2]